MCVRARVRVRACACACVRALACGHSAWRKWAGAGWPCLCAEDAAAHAAELDEQAAAGDLEHVAVAARHFRYCGYCCGCCGCCGEEAAAGGLEPDLWMTRALMNDSDG